MNNLEDISFEERGSKRGTVKGIVMPSGVWVAQEILELALQNAKSRLQDIDWRKKVCSATFFDPAEWKHFRFGKQLALGRCIKFFSVNGILPIEVANPDKKGKRFYRRCT